MQKSDEEILKALEADADILRRAILIRNRYSAEQSPAHVQVVPEPKKRGRKKSAPKLAKSRTRKTPNGLNLKQEIVEMVFKTDTPLRSAFIKEALISKHPNLDQHSVERRVADVLAKELLKDPRFASRKADAGKGKVYGRKEIINKPHN